MVRGGGPARALAPDVVVDGIAPDGSPAEAVLAGREAVIGAVAGIVVSGGASGAGRWRDVREVQFGLIRHEETWLVTRVTPVQALRR